MTKQFLLDVDRGIGTTKQGPIGVAKGVPSDTAETVLGCKLATFVMDRDGMALSSFLIHFGACRTGSRPTSYTRHKTPSGAADVILLGRSSMIRTTSFRAREYEAGPIRLPFDLKEHRCEVWIDRQFVS